MEMEKRDVGDIPQWWQIKPCLAGGAKIVMEITR